MRRAMEGISEAYGPWQSVYTSFAKWWVNGTLEWVFLIHSKDTDRENLSTDYTCIKLHENANWRWKTDGKTTGRTKYKHNEMVHAVVNSLINLGGISRLRRKWSKLCLRSWIVRKSWTGRQQSTGRSFLHSLDHSQIYFRTWHQIHDPPQWAFKKVTIITFNCFLLFIFNFFDISNNLSKLIFR